MAAASKVIYSGPRKYVVNITGVFSVADETDTVVVDRSTLIGPDGTEPSKVVIEEITWAVGPNFDYVLLEWDNASDAVIEYLSGAGYMDYRMYGGKAPSASDGTGDVVLTTSGGAAGDTYSILLVCRLKD